jgi:dTDP-glucose 4,6-dehydratase
MKTLFVTGGAGFIGSAFVRLALATEPDCTVINYDALTYAGNPDNLEDLDARQHRFVHGNLLDRASVLEALPKGADAVIHLAAETHVDRSIHEADAFVRTNVLGTQILLDAARARGVRRFLLVSTIEVLGGLPEDEVFLFRESAPYRPTNAYSASKAAAEHLALAAHRTYGLDVMVTRSGNNYGPRQFPEKLIPLTIARALRGEAIPIYGDGDQVRDWIHVEDHCRALWAALERGRPGQIYHVGALNPRLNIEVVLRILERLEQPESLIRFVRDRPGHDRRYALDPTKAERELAWKPQETWEAGMARTICWYQQNPAWLAKAQAAGRAFFERQYGNRAAAG